MKKITLGAILSLFLSSSASAMVADEATQKEQFLKLLYHIYKDKKYEDGSTIQAFYQKNKSLYFGDKNTINTYLNPEDFTGTYAKMPEQLAVGGPLPLSPLTVAIANIQYEEDYNPDKEMDWLLNLADIDVNKANDLGMTPLHYAAHYNNYEAFKKLLNKKASLNFQDIQGNSATHAFAKSRAIRVEKNGELVLNLGFLFDMLKGGADFTLQNKAGETPISIITQKINTAIPLIPSLEKIRIEFRDELIKTLRRDQDIAKFKIFIDQYLEKKRTIELVDALNALHQSLTAVAGSL